MGGPQVGLRNGATGSESNQRPPAYKAGALPLSYSSVNWHPVKESNLAHGALEALSPALEHYRILFGASSGIRTLLASLEDWSTAIYAKPAKDLPLLGNGVSLTQSPIVL